MQKYRSEISLLLGSALTLSAAVALASPGPEAPAVDLLRTVPTVVAVSSVVKGSSDKPDFLVDGDVETTWNSLSGDLRGWVAVRIPRDAQVTAIKLTAGYPKVKPKGDLFVMNHRIKKVRVLRDNVLVGEYPLNPEERGLQTLPVRVAGGDLRIEVVETVAGTKTSWRELCISELQVMGVPPPSAPPAPVPAGAATTPAVTVKPVVRVGSLDAGTRKGPLALSDLAGPYESPEAFAKAQGGALRDPKLTMPKVPAANGPFLALSFIAVNDRCRFGIQTFRGWFFSGELGACSDASSASPTKASSASPPDMGIKPPSPSELAMVTQLELYPSSVGQSPVLLTEILLEEQYEPTGFIRGSCSAALYVCGIGSSGRPSCTSSLDLGSGSGLCGSIDGESEWSWRYRASWLPTGTLTASLDDGASSGPTECEGSRSACVRAEKEKLRRVRASVPDSAKALAKSKPVVFP